MYICVYILTWVREYVATCTFYCIIVGCLSDTANEGLKWRKQQNVILTKVSLNLTLTCKLELNESNLFKKYFYFYLSLVFDNKCR